MTGKRNHFKTVQAWKRPPSLMNRTRVKGRHWLRVRNAWTFPLFHIKEDGQLNHVQSINYIEATALIETMASIHVACFYLGAPSSFS